MNIKPNDIVKIKGKKELFFVEDWSSETDLYTIRYSESEYTMQVKAIQVEEIYRNIKEVRNMEILDEIKSLSPEYGALVNKTLWDLT